MSQWLASVKRSAYLFLSRTSGAGQRGEHVKKEKKKEEYEPTASEKTSQLLVNIGFIKHNDCSFTKQIPQGRMSLFIKNNYAGASLLTNKPNEPGAQLVDLFTYEPVSSDDDLIILFDDAINITATKINKIVAGL